MSKIVLDLLTLDEVAAACRTSISTVRYWVHIRRLESVKIGKRRLVTREAFAAFLAEHCDITVPSAPATIADAR